MVTGPEILRRGARAAFRLWCETRSTDALALSARLCALLPARPNDPDEVVRVCPWCLREAERAAAGQALGNLGFVISDGICPQHAAELSASALEAV